VTLFTRRLEPYLNAPSPSKENANSPPGPLQNQIKEPELTDWRTIDWAAVVAATPVQETEINNEGVSWTTATATGFGDPLNDFTDSGYEFGGYGLLCLSPCSIACTMATATATAPAPASAPASANEGFADSCYRAITITSSRIRIGRW
jgi:hypothetical protein